VILAGHIQKEKSMRNTTLALGAIAFALSSLSSVAEAAKVKGKPAVTTLGCQIGKETWDASIGACVPRGAAKAKRATTALGCQIGKETWDASMGACVPKAKSAAKKG
jgi:hypothetical protein